MTIRPIDIRRPDVSAKRRFDGMTFRENDVAPIPISSLKARLNILSLALSWALWYCLCCTHVIFNCVEPPLKARLNILSLALSRALWCCLCCTHVILLGVEPPLKRRLNTDILTSKFSDHFSDERLNGIQWNFDSRCTIREGWNPCSFFSKL